MRVAFEWTALLIAFGVFIAMLVGLWRHQAHASEYVWSTVPWIIVALCAAPAVRQLLAVE